MYAIGWAITIFAAGLGINWYLHSWVIIFIVATLVLLWHTKMGKPDYQSGGLGEVLLWLASFIFLGGLAVGYFV